MIIAFIISNVITLILLEKFKYKIFEFPKLKTNKNGIQFFSFKKHRLYVERVKIFKIADNYYLKTDKAIIIFKNIKNVVLKNGYMYFKALGEVEINFNFENLYRYFNFNINLKNVDFNNLKQIAILDLMNNGFEVEKSENFKKFLKFIKNILKIEINDKKLTIFSNNLNISYQIVYKCNNKIKKINIQNTIGKT